MDEQTRTVDRPLFFLTVPERGLGKSKRNKGAYVATVAVYDSNATEAAWF